MASKVLCNPKWSGVPFARLTRVKYLQNRLIFLWLLTSLVCVVVCWLCCHRTRGPLWTQVPLQPFHPDNKEPPAARTGGLLNEISYQSTNSCGLCLAIRSGYESPSAALNSYYLDVYLLWGEKKTPALFKISLCGSRLPKQGNAPPKERVSFTCYWYVAHPTSSSLVESCPKELTCSQHVRSAAATNHIICN